MREQFLFKSPHLCAFPFLSNLLLAFNLRADNSGLMSQQGYIYQRFVQFLSIVVFSVGEEIFAGGEIFVRETRNNLCVSSFSVLLVEGRRIDRGIYWTAV